MAQLSLPLSDSSHLQIASFFPNLAPIFYSAIRMGVFGFLGTHTHGETPSLPVIKKSEAYFKRSFVMGRDEGLCRMRVLKAHLLVLSVRDRQSCEITSITPSHSFFTSLLWLCFRLTDLCTTKCRSHFVADNYSGMTWQCAERIPPLNPIFCLWCCR